VRKNNASRRSIFGSACKIFSNSSFAGKVIQPKSSTNNYPNDSFRHCTLAARRSRDKNGFRPWSHAEAKKKPYAVRINRNNGFVRLYQHAIYFCDLVFCESLLFSFNSTLEAYVAFSLLLRKTLRLHKIRVKCRDWSRLYHFYLSLFGTIIECKFKLSSWLRRK